MNTPFTMIAANGCKNCKHAHKHPGGLECRAAPPTANAIMGPDGKGGYQVQAVVSLFPLVGPDIVCGAHKRALVTVDGTIAGPATLHG